MCIETIVVNDCVTRKVNWLEACYKVSQYKCTKKARSECAPKQDILLIVERTMYNQFLFWKRQVGQGFLLTCAR